MIIHSISGPRNISTALMYSFAQRDDMSVVDEPFYAAYLDVNPGVVHPDRDLILGAQSRIPREVYQQLLDKAGSVEHLYIKDMAHHFSDMHQPVFPGAKAIFLIRDPAKLIASFQKVVANPTIKDIGLKNEWELFQTFVENGVESVVISTETLAANPESSLMNLCDWLGLNFDSKMLSWAPGPKDYDGCWAAHWYSNTHASSGFKPFESHHPELDEHGRALLEEAMPYYRELEKHNIL